MAQVASLRGRGLSSLPGMEEGEERGEPSGRGSGGRGRGVEGSPSLVRRHGGEESPLVRSTPAMMSESAAEGGSDRTPLLQGEGGGSALLHGEGRSSLLAPLQFDGRDVAVGSLLGDGRGMRGTASPKASSSRPSVYSRLSNSQKTSGQVGWSDQQSPPFPLQQQASGQEGAGEATGSPSGEAEDPLLRGQAPS